MSIRRLQYDHRPSQKTLSRMAYNRFSGAKWTLSTSQIFKHLRWSQSSDPTHYFDSKVLGSYTDCHPVKQRRATLGSDPPRDNRMRLRRIFRPGKPRCFPTSYLSEYPELPPMPQKTPGVWGQSPQLHSLYSRAENSISR